MKPEQALLVKSGVVAVMRKLPFEHIESITESLVTAGITGLEVTVDSDRAFEAIAKMKAIVGNRAVVGAGTVLDGETAEKAIEAGAKFIFAPTLDQQTIEVANKHEIVVIPGIFTPTEALQAIRWGADIVKVFPADAVGPQFIKGLQGPLGHIPMMPTGGIDIDNIAEYRKAGAIAVGAGGSLLKKSYIDQQDWDGLQQHAKTFVEAARL